MCAQFGLSSPFVVGCLLLLLFCLVRRPGLLCLVVRLSLSGCRAGTAIVVVVVAARLPRFVSFRSFVASGSVEW